MKRFFVVFVCLIVVLLSSRALLNDTFFQVHDFTHVARLVELDQALRDGHFPPRWSKDLGYGYGMPLFTFYGPVPYYVAELFYLIGFSGITSIKLMLILMTVLAFSGMYLFASRLFGRLGGTVAATAFLLIPYRALDLYVRGAFSELFSISLVPFVLYSFMRIQESKQSKWIAWSAILIAVFLQTHNLMTMLLLPVIYVCAWVLIGYAKNKKRYLVRVHMSLLFGLLASVYYLIPSYAEKGLTQVDRMIGGYGYYGHHFLYIRQLFSGSWGYEGSIAGIEDGLSFNLGILQILLAGLGALCWWFRSRSKRSRILLAAVCFVVAVSLAMTTYRSQPIWDRIPQFLYLQFPWRFLSVVAVFLPILIGGTVYMFKQKIARLLFTLVAIAVMLGVNLSLFAPKGYLDHPEGIYTEDPVAITRQLSDILPDYLPVWMSDIPEIGLPQFEVSDMSTEVTVQVNRTHEKLIQFRLDRPAELTARISWFPNWTVYDGLTKIPYEVDSIHGFMQVPLEAGDHTLSFRFEDTPVRTYSNIISVLGILAIAGALLYARSS